MITPMNVMNVSYWQSAIKSGYEKRLCACRIDISELPDTFKGRLYGNHSTERRHRCTIKEVFFVVRKWHIATQCRS